jgi:hypothetical protein
VYLNPAAKDSIFKYCIEATYDKIQYYHDRCVADTNLRSKTTEKSTICDMVAAFAAVNRGRTDNTITKRKRQEH